jgi:hypothetical protein
MEKELKNQILQHIINEVEIEILNYKCDYVGVQRGIATGYYFMNEDLYITYQGGGTGKKIGDECKLILHPKSDFTAYIDCPEVMGELFIPLTQILKASCFDTSKMTWDEQLSFKDSILDIMSYDDALMLLEWDFNIFDLPEHLWIDKNTLK